MRSRRLKMQEHIVNRQVNESNYRYIYYLRPIGISLSVKYNF